MKISFRKYGMNVMIVCSIMAGILMVNGHWVEAKEQISPKEAASLVKKAIAIVEEKGKAGFEELRGNDFVFGRIYPVITDYSGRVFLHPTKPHLEGRSLLGMKDRDGKRFVAEMIALAREHGSGWVEYMWPKPGEKDPSTKVSYVAKGQCDGVDVICIVGLYDVNKEFCEKEAGH
ncbi:MAG: cache domain-containing protein [Thermodesulfobacteriota bacterium]|nr:cache domain-containing protein [Thermodesulfobacteriota bacterium]